MVSLRGFGTQSPFETDWGNFQNWLNSSQGWILYFAIFLTILVILVFVAWLRVGRVPGPQHDGKLEAYLSGRVLEGGEPSPQQDEGESEGK
jgi:hypothetical protein